MKYLVCSFLKSLPTWFRATIYWKWRPNLCFLLRMKKKVILYGEGSTVDLNNEITSSSDPNDQVTKEKQHGCIISAAEVETWDTKSPNKIKYSKNNVLNTNKSAKNLSNSKGTAVFGRNTKPGLSKSLSFPARGRHSDVMKRSIELHPVKTDARQNHKSKGRVQIFKSGLKFWFTFELIREGVVP